MSNMHTLV